MTAASFRSSATLCAALLVTSLLAQAGSWMAAGL